RLRGLTPMGFYCSGTSLGLAAALAATLAPHLAQAGVASLHLPTSGPARAQVAHAQQLVPSGAFTLEAWVRTLRNDGNSSAVIGQTWNHGIYLALDGERRMRLLVGGTGVTAVGGTPIPLNTWTHVAATFGPEGRRYYVNGVLDYQAAATTTLP